MLCYVMLCYDSSYCSFLSFFALSLLPVYFDLIVSLFLPFSNFISSIHSNLVLPYLFYLFSSFSINLPLFSSSLLLLFVFFSPSLLFFFFSFLISSFLPSNNCNFTLLLLSLLLLLLLLFLFLFYFIFTSPV